MTRVDFYLLPVAEPHGRLSFACRLAEKAYISGHRVYVHSPSQAAAREFDDLLWGFRDTSFVPHGLAGDAPAAPVEIGFGADPGDHHDMLINLSDEIPRFFSRFERMAEIVLNDPQCRRTSRERWSFYRDRGYQLQHHDIQNLRTANG